MGFCLETIISDKKGSDRIANDWKKAFNLSLGRGTFKQVYSYNVILDKIFDIARFKCPIISCEESNCDGCNQNLHISCKYSKENSIPVSELQFMKSQRDNIGCKSEMQMGLVVQREITS